MKTQNNNATTEVNQRRDEIKKSLFCRYDELNIFWLKAESQLRSFHIPRPVSFCFSRVDADKLRPDGNCANEYLGLQKVRGSWCICYYIRRVGSELDGDWVPITECSVEIRVLAAKHFPELQEAVIKSAELFIPQVDKAIQFLKSAIKCMPPIPDIEIDPAKPDEY